ncbi:MAG: UpxY family transcription antiterminator [Candidatus Kapaibacterium sp.]
MSQSSEHIERQWYPLYTRSRFEKKAYENLRRAGMEAFLPLRTTVRRWSDRKKKVEMPLIPSYIFAKLTRAELYQALDITGISRYICFNGRPATVRESEISAMMTALRENAEIEVREGTIERGAEVKFTSGIFSGYEGRVIDSSGKSKLVIELESIGKTMLVTVDRDQLRTS